MFRRFRRGSKISCDEQSDGISRQNSLATLPKTTFFDLPAELRNAIYELAADSVILSANPHRNTKPLKKRVNSIPSLLITSHQSRNEYLPILLSLAKITLAVIDFNFGPIIRLSGSLYPTERKALCMNTSLTIALSFTTGGAGKMYANLRRWGTYRAAGSDRLPWKYRLGAEGYVNAFWLSYQRCVGTLSSVQAVVDEATKWELQMILDEVNRSQPVGAVGGNSNGNSNSSGSGSGSGNGNGN